MAHLRLERKQAQQSRLVALAEVAEVADRDDLEPYLFQMGMQQRLLLVPLQLRRAMPQLLLGKPSGWPRLQARLGRQQRQQPHHPAAPVEFSCDLRF